MNTGFVRTSKARRMASCAASEPRERCGKPLKSSASRPLGSAARAAVSTGSSAMCSLAKSRPTSQMSQEGPVEKRSGPTSGGCRCLSAASRRRCTSSPSNSVAQPRLPMSARPSFMNTLAPNLRCDKPAADKSRTPRRTSTRMGRLSSRGISLVARMLSKVESGASSRAKWKKRWVFDSNLWTMCPEPRSNLPAGSASVSAKY
mmetsp:Transcript_119007/g.333358  ORF Transcript_119007/g.333358 Transcript_119007/m.333358 type:complete len:203 (-) Transcript_119007:439-1047(-)